jgi:uncharacterized protein (UPF0261 family)
MPKTVCIIGAFDTKGEDHAYLRSEIAKAGHHTLTVNIGVLGSTALFPVDYEAEDVVHAAGLNLEQIRARKDKAEAMKAFDQAAPLVIRKLYEQGRFDGIIGMGGSGGSSIIASAMRALPIGVPKVLVIRTNLEENRRMGEIFAGKANRATGPVAFLMPLRGVSMLDGDGQPFCDREADPGNV